MHGSVIFHRPSELQVSAAMRGWWNRPVADLLIEAGAAGGFGNDVHDACTEFVGWCLAQSPRPGSFSILSLPGLPWSDSDHDPWAWYERLMKEVEKWDPPPVLVDLDDFQITHRGEVLWPPRERRRPQRTDRRLRLIAEPFPIGWFGHGLSNKRQARGTYDCYPPEEMPPIQVPLVGTFDWLLAVPEQSRSIAADLDQTRVALSLLLEKYSGSLPTDFVLFFQSPSLWRRIGSWASTHLHLDSTAVSIYGGLGSLIRFMSDSQGCRHWHLYLSACGKRQSVVVTHFYRGSESVHVSSGQPHPKDITMCSAKFEEFMYRFWIENEIINASRGDREMPPGGEEYLAFYGTRPKAG